MEYDFQYHKRYFFSFDSSQDYFRKDLVKLLHAKTVIRVCIIFGSTVESPKGKKRAQCLISRGFLKFSRVGKITNALEICPGISECKWTKVQNKFKTFWPLFAGGWNFFESVQSWEKERMVWREGYQKNLFLAVSSSTAVSVLLHTGTCINDVQL